MDRPHDTLRDLDAGTPAAFVLAARLLPAGILGQFLLAGLALFREGGSWAAHAILGFSLILPVGILLASALLVARLRGFGWWAGLVALLYAVQAALGAGGAPMALALHPLNGALLLTASLVLLAKVERRRAAEPGRAARTTSIASAP